MDAKPRLFDQARSRFRTLHYSYRTEQQYLGWIRRFILFHHKRHPAELGAQEVEAFLSHLAVDRKVSAPTQNQALAAILFLYRHVLEIELPWLHSVVRAKPSQHLPVVLSVTEVRAVLGHLRGEYWLIASLLYGAGLRLLEPAMVGPSSRMHSRASTRTRASSGRGSTSFPRVSHHATSATAPGVVTTSRRRRCSAT